jgi:hypothetical protein
MLLLAVGTFASAVVPARLAPDVVRRLYVDPDRRVFALAAAIAIFAGLLISRSMS